MFASCVSSFACVLLLCCLSPTLVIAQAQRSADYNPQKNSGSTPYHARPTMNLCSLTVTHRYFSISYQHKNESNVAFVDFLYSGDADADDDLECTVEEKHTCKAEIKSRMIPCIEDR